MRNGSAGDEDHGDGSAVSSAAIMAFRKKSLFEMAVRTAEKDVVIYLSGGAERRDPSTKGAGRRIECVMPSEKDSNATFDDKQDETLQASANGPKTSNRKALIIFLSVLLALLFVVITIIVVLFVVADNVGYAYALMIDAGSTSSKVSVLKWLDYPFRKNGWVEQVNYTVKEPGISAYGDNPPQAGQELFPVLHSMLQQNVPANKRKSTSLYLAATAGMRLLDINEPLKSDAIMQDLRQKLPHVGATVHNVFSDIRIISGSTEGRYGWVAANYLDKKLGDPEGTPPKPAYETVGMLDLGGASTQIAFVPTKDGSAQHTMPISMFGQSYNLYSYSFLCYGKEANGQRYIAQIISEAKNLNTVMSPCHLRGYEKTVDTATIFTAPCVTSKFAEQLIGSQIKPPANAPAKIKIVGEGDSEKCSMEVKKLFPSRGCSHGTCSFNNVYQPPVRGKFFAFSGFYFPIEFFKFPTGGKNLTRSQVRTAVDAYCRKNWKEVAQQNSPGTHKFVADYCFDGHYIENLLEGYGFTSSDSWRNIEFVKKIAGASASWAFGYVVDATGYIASTEPKIYLQQTGFIAGVTIMAVAMVLTIASLILVTSKKCCT
ncbi:hypothetical protein SprV_0100357200 [Sparganum proliferum]